MELILEKLAAGETVEQIVAAHPSLTEDGARAAIDYADCLSTKRRTWLRLWWLGMGTN